MAAFFRAFLLLCAFAAGMVTMHLYEAQRLPAATELDRVTLMRPVPRTDVPAPVEKLTDVSPPKINTTEHTLPQHEPPLATTTEQKTPPQSTDTGIVEFVYDGDTVRLADKRKVRLTGIDTPEMNYGKGDPECFAREAKKELEALVLHKNITLVKDVSETDRYGRLLRYVYVHTDTWGDVFVNNVLVGQGFGIAKQYPPDIAQATTLAASMIRAQQSRLGLWTACNAHK